MYLFLCLSRFNCWVKICVPQVQPIVLPSEQEEAEWEWAQAQ